MYHLDLTAFHVSAPPAVQDPFWHEVARAADVCAGFRLARTASVSYARAYLPTLTSACSSLISRRTSPVTPLLIR